MTRWQRNHRGNGKWKIGCSCDAVDVERVYSCIGGLTNLSGLDLSAILAMGTS